MNSRLVGTGKFTDLELREAAIWNYELWRNKYIKRWTNFNGLHCLKKSCIYKYYEYPHFRRCIKDWLGSGGWILIRHQKDTFAKMQETLGFPKKKKNLKLWFYCSDDPIACKQLNLGVVSNR